MIQKLFHTSYYNNYLFNEIIQFMFLSSSIMESSRSGKDISNDTGGFCVITMVILDIIIWLTDFMCCDWSIPGP